MDPGGIIGLVATRKQRRRREKEQRHDYEIVYLDDEGNEVEPDETDVRAPAKRGASPKGSSSKPSTTPGRRGRVPQPPSWRRVGKRGAIFAPLFIATVLLLGGKHMKPGTAVVQAVVLVALFVPFSYFLDSLVYRSYQKKLGRGPAPKR